MLFVTSKQKPRLYVIDCKYLKESGTLNERNVRNACKKYMERKGVKK